MKSPRRTARRRLDQRLVGLDLGQRPPRGWIRAIRDALAMTTGELGQRMADQFALARPGHQHVTHVMPDSGVRLLPEQRRGGHRPGNYSAPGIQGERGQAGQVLLAGAGPGGG